MGKGEPGEDGERAPASWPPVPLPVTFGLAAVGLAAIVLAVLDALHPKEVQADGETISLLVIALAAFVFPVLRKLNVKTGELEIYRAVEGIRNKIDEVQGKVGEVAERQDEVSLVAAAGVGGKPGVPLGPAAPPGGAPLGVGLTDWAEAFDLAARDPAAPRPVDLDPADPNKGRFGGSASRDGRELRAEVRRAGIGRDWYRVRLEVRQTDPASPLRDKVDFHLHDTFRPSVQSAVPHGGVAALEVIAWGAFTVGAVTDGGATRLELDLADLRDAPPGFREA